MLCHAVPCCVVCLGLQKQKKQERKKRDAAEAKAEELGLEAPARKVQKVPGGGGLLLIVGLPGVLLGGCLGCEAVVLRVIAAASNAG
jgi:hypothetical protein